VARIADATVVGSALVDEISTALALNRDPAAKVLDRAAAMAQAVHSARARG
jgi:tryptophan synthase alpha chain